MKLFKNDDELERELRRQRPEPRDELVALVSERVAERRRGSRAGFRLAFAGVLTAGMLAGLAAVGGLSYAADAVQTAARGAQHVVAPVKHAAPAKPAAVSSADKQYKVAFCKHYGDNKHRAKTILIDPSAVPAQLKHSDKGSHVGACTSGDFKPGKGKDKDKKGKKGKSTVVKKTVVKKHGKK